MTTPSHLAPARPAPPRERRRVGVYDVVRGFSVLSMVGFHLCYDLTSIFGVALPWFCDPFEGVWRASISWTFLFVAGCMCSLSRSNARRGLVYALWAAAIFAVTSLAGVDTPISFGIIFCMAASTLLYALLDAAHLAPEGPVAAVVLALAFLASLGVPRGTFGLGWLSVVLPRLPYQSGLLSWAGFPGPAFASGDYYPIIPYTLLYLAAAALGRSWARAGYPRWACDARLAPLTWVGRHALVLYVVHQPVLLVACSLVLGRPL